MCFTYKGLVKNCTPWYSWNTAKIGVKHQSINQSNVIEIGKVHFSKKRYGCKLNGHERLQHNYI